MKGDTSQMIAKLHLYTLLKMTDNTVLAVLYGIIRQASKQSILPRFNGSAVNDINYKANMDIVTDADNEMQSSIIDGLHRNWPHISVLGEEQSHLMQHAVMSNDKQAFWVLDPIDGTSNFAFGIPYFCISLSLIYQGVVRLGLVYDPMRDECFFASHGAGAWFNGNRLHSRELKAKADLKHAMALIDFKRLPMALSAGLASRPPYRSQRSFGASALDWCWIAANRCQLYLHGDQKLWDYSAGQLILREAGGMSCAFDGSSVFNNSLQSRTVIGASHPFLFEQWREWLSPYLHSFDSPMKRGDVRLIDPG
ncbi:inositol monophosphatase [Enterovibrio makurazakiensis]|uniref:inositol monophosphatase family protein n=1 Tax=Enterovibrio makurazakiensis TaxID=2910232 RepID=UPI003D1A9387